VAVAAQAGSASSGREQTTLNALDVFAQKTVKIFHIDVAAQCSGGAAATAAKPTEQQRDHQKQLFQLPGLAVAVQTLAVGDFADSGTQTEWERMHALTTKTSRLNHRTKLRSEVSAAVGCQVSDVELDRCIISRFFPGKDVSDDMSFAELMTHIQHGMQEASERNALAHAENLPCPFETDVGGSGDGG